MYTIVFKKSVARDIRRIPAVIIRRIKERIARLAEEPTPAGAEKLQGYDHIFRIRVGDYRIIYEIQKNILVITVIRVGNRKDIYQSL